MKEHRISNEIEILVKIFLVKRKQILHYFLSAKDKHKVFSLSLGECWSMAIGVLFSAPTVHRSLLRQELPAKIPLLSIPLMLNHRRSMFQSVHEHSQ